MQMWDAPAVLRQLEATEANLAKLERLCSEISMLVPSGINFGPNAEYENRCRVAAELLKHLPKIDGWKPELAFQDLNDIAQNRLDALEIGEPSAQIAVERSLEEPERELREYRFRLNRRRRSLIGDALNELITFIDEDIRAIRKSGSQREQNGDTASSRWQNLRTHINQIDTLLGSSFTRPPSWNDLCWHLQTGEQHDFGCIEAMDWPSVKNALKEIFFGKDDPVRVDVEDLAQLKSARLAAAIPTKLNWSTLTDEDFERLIFTLLGSEPSYENPQWLMATHAADRGRDISVTHVHRDPLMGTTRRRVIVQCKHWQRRSINDFDISALITQMKHWDTPRVDVLIIATTGRFTSDAVDTIDRHNLGDNALRIEMWPESHLESLLAARPALIAEFRLR